MSDSRYEKTLRSLLSKLSEYDLTGKVIQDSQVIKGHGGACDVYTGRYAGKAVAIKKLRIHVVSNVAKMVSDELMIWSMLHDNNILPLLGFALEEDAIPALISEWMENGTISTYLRMNPLINIFELAKGIASGLHYLHKKKVVHSDLKSDNVFVSTDGRPLLADFGISRLLLRTRTYSTASDLKGSARWMATELFSIGVTSVYDMESSLPKSPTFATDVWAFGMTIYELLTRDIPYAHLLGANDLQVMWAISRYELPPTPSGICDRPLTEQSLWNLCKKCWRRVPDLRPQMENIMGELDSQSFTENLIVDPLTYGSVLDVTDQISDVAPNAFGSGGYSDIFLGQISNADGSKKAIAIKRVRQVQEYKERERFYYECSVWKSLNHRNIVPFLGVAYLKDSLAMVSPFYKNGDVREFLQSQSSPSMSFKLMLGIAEGIRYLHVDKGIVHGDLSMGNILVSDTADACIADFGLSRWISHTGSQGEQRPPPGKVRYMAPELLGIFPRGEVGEPEEPSTKSDIYAFSMVSLEIVTGLPAFRYIYNANGILSALVKCQRPQRDIYPDVQDNLWELLSKCWAGDPPDRPDAQELLERVRQAADSNASTVTLADIETLILNPATAVPEKVAKLQLIEGLEGVTLTYHCGGPLSEIFAGFVHLRTGPVKLAFRSIRSQFPENRKNDIKRKLLQEMAIWIRLRHTNIAPVFGLFEHLQPLPSIVMLFYREGNVQHYLENRKFLSLNARCQLVSDVAEGIRYLHKEGLVHGDLRPSKVLITDYGRAVVSGTGLFHVFDNFGQEWSNSGFSQSARYAAPETYNDENFRTKESDVWSFAMTALEILTNCSPFHDRRVVQAVLEVIQGRKPEREDAEVIPDHLWSLLSSCWKSNASDRLNIDQVCRVLALHESNVAVAFGNQATPKPPKENYPAGEFTMGSFDDGAAGSGSASQVGLEY